MQRERGLVAVARLFYYVDHARRRVWTSLIKRRDHEHDRIDRDYFHDLLSLGYDRAEAPPHGP